MCGIAGVYGRSDLEAVRRMVTAMRSRGPDGSGVWADRQAGVALGHARLAILDTSQAGAQPMQDATGRLHVTYNGEIYNFLSLRSELQAQGYVFGTRCDTEVLLAAYHRWGPACVERLVGMFAFAVFDAAPPAGQPRMFLARDRLGIKPLLYSQQDGAVWFASELRALRASSAVAAELDSDALLDYFAVGSVYQPSTLLAEVQALPAGCCMHLSEEGPGHLHRYWDLHTSTRGLRHSLRGISAAEGCHRVREALQEATRMHLVADVPVGAFLSGGIDSTAVVALMARAQGRPVQTFAVGFESAYAHMDERGYARRAAEALGAVHHEVEVTGDDARELFEQVVQATDQPSLDGTNSWIVARAARSYVTVALSGLGGDELFAGYDHFRWLASMRPFGVRSRTVRRLTEAAMRLRPNAYVGRAMLYQAEPAARLAMLRRLVGDYAMAQVARHAWIGRFRARLHGRYAAWLQESMDAVQQVSYTEVQGYLASTLLRDNDVMSMANSLEVRPLLLHHPLVELAYALPAQHKLRGKQVKAVLVQALQELLPAEVRKRRKRGFEMPFVGWMGGPLRERIRHLLHLPAAEALFTRAYLNSTDRALRAGKPPRALWAWAVLLAWLEQEGLSVPAE